MGQVPCSEHSLGSFDFILKVTCRGLVLPYQKGESTKATLGSPLNGVDIGGYPKASLLFVALTLGCVAHGLGFFSGLMLTWGWPCMR